MVRQVRARDAALAAERQEAGWRIARAAAAVLRTDFGATRVFAFGSLVRGGMHEDSDVDLAVEGLAPGRYFEALGQVLSLRGPPVSLAPLESCRSHIREAVLREGVPI